MRNRHQIAVSEADSLSISARSGAEVLRVLVKGSLGFGAFDSSEGGRELQLLLLFLLESMD